MKIGTHDSATGERSLWYCLPLVPFACTQSKTIWEQFEAGCRLFDLRTKFHNGKWRAAHGWWFSSKSMDDILYELNTYSSVLDKVCVHMTYEGKTKNSKEFLEQAKLWKEKYPNIVWGPICTKYGKDSKGVKVSYDILIPADSEAWGGKQGFLPLDGKHWQTYLPIPWLWKKIYFNNPKFNEDYYLFVDFL